MKSFYHHPIDSLRFRAAVTEGFKTYHEVLPYRGKASGWLALGVQTNPGDEFKRAIKLANSWARKTNRSFDVLMFSPTDYTGIPVELCQHTGYASFIAIYYNDKSGAFPVGIDPYAA